MNRNQRFHGITAVPLLVALAMPLVCFSATPDKDTQWAPNPGSLLQGTSASITLTMSGACDDTIDKTLDPAPKIALGPALGVTAGTPTHSGKCEITIPLTADKAAQIGPLLITLTNAAATADLGSARLSIVSTANKTTAWTSNPASALQGQQTDVILTAPKTVCSDDLDGSLDNSTVDVRQGFLVTGANPKHSGRCEMKISLNADKNAQLGPLRLTLSDQKKADLGFGSITVTSVLPGASWASAPEGPALARSKALTFPAAVGTTKVVP